jgi:hypothetical protein
MSLKTLSLGTLELANIASALMDNIFKCQDKIDGTKNKFIIQSHEEKMKELKILLDKVEKEYYK